MDPLTCREVVELVTDHLEGALDPAVDERFRRHLADCPGCGVYLDQIRETVDRLGQVPLATLSDDAQATLLNAFRDLHR